MPEPDSIPRFPLFADVPAGWHREEKNGYAILAEPERHDPLAFAESVARGLDDRPRWLSCRWLYDAAGSELFERITEQPEYYQTRTENGILARSAAAFRARTGDVTVVELGSGSSTKTRRILEAWSVDGPARYVPIDVSHSALEAACASLAHAFPDLAVEAIASTYERGLALAAGLSPLLLTFLGSTVGNFNSEELDAFLDMVAGHLSPGDFLLLGIDLVKDTRRLEAAYNDAAGVTARFILNLFARMNRELGCRIPLDAVEYVSRYNESSQQIEIYARFRREVRIELPLIGREFCLAAGEQVLIEISRKFRPDDMAATLGRFGFTLERTETDTEKLFAVQLFRRQPGPRPAGDEERHETVPALSARG